MTLALAGFLTGLALIVPIGSQNAYVLRVGLERRHVTLVVLVCLVSDVVLIAAGVLGVGALVESHPRIVTAVTWIGVAYLVGYGLRSLWSARRPGALEAAGGPVRSARAVLATTLALTWLNPHVYLDTVLMLGTLANAHGPDDKWSFGAGAMAGSLVWFVGLGYGARALGAYVRNPRTWQVIDVAIGVLMIALGLRLALS